MAAASASVHHHPPILESVQDGLHRADDGIDGADKLVSGFKATAASRTFRNYGLLNVLQNTYPTNIAGNFRGMVISGRWKTVFHYISEHEQMLKNIDTFASFSPNFTAICPQF